MRPVAVLYATREGQTRKIAEYVADRLHSHGLQAGLYDLRDSRPVPELASQAAVVLAASVHVGRHEKEMCRFVRQHRAELERMPAAFLSVSLSEAGAEMLGTTPESCASAAADVQKMLEDFYAQTGWRPARVQPVAGALRYTRYKFLVRFLMKRIARSAGGSTDTSRNHEYTDWAALDRFVEELAHELHAAAEAAAPSLAG
jgi:menaquinone-dependent protoporphyrinogen oxidase